MSFSFKKELSQESGEFTPIVPGKYIVVFDSLEEKPTMQGGVQWSAKMKIPLTGRTFFLNWNVENASETAQRIAREQVSQIAELLGCGDDISIEKLKTNKQFMINLEQRVVGDKVYYQTKGKWELVAQPVTAAKVAVTTAKKEVPWKTK